MHEKAFDPGQVFLLLRRCRYDEPSLLDSVKYELYLRIADH